MGSIGERQQRKGRKPSKDGRVYTTLRLDPKLVKLLDAECQRRLVSRTYLVERAIERFLCLREGS